MKFEVIDFNEKSKWTKIVKDNEIYYQWQYVDAFYRIGDGIPKLAYAEYNGEYVFNVFLLRDIATDLKISKDKYPYYDIITPYGYGGVFCTSDNKKLLQYFFLQFEIYCIENNIVSEFLRLSPFLDNYKYYDKKYVITNISKTIYMKLESPEQIWNDMESRSRNTIRKAKK